jgi:hypothetical protein
MTEEELKEFEREAVADEEFDHDIGEFVKVDDPADIERFLWHEIPAEIANSRGTVRLVPSDERRKLMTFGPDGDD